VPERLEQLLYLLFALIPGVIRPQGDLHGGKAARSGGCASSECQRYA
jgi:hypothetical protein